MTVNLGKVIDVIELYIPFKPAMEIIVTIHLTMRKQSVVITPLLDSNNFYVYMVVRIVIVKKV